MKAVVLRGKEDIRIEEVPIPALSDSEVLIKVKAAGVCGTDFHTYLGHRPVELPRILGHEFAGEVYEVGERVDEFSKGDRVVVQPNFGCGKCHLCRTGRCNICSRRRSLGVNTDGVFAEFAKAPVEYVWRIPEDMPYDRAALVEPLSVAVRAVERARISISDKVLILGAGTIGLLVLQLSSTCRADITVVDVLDNRLQLAKKMGARVVLNARTTDVPQEVREATDGEGVDIVVETSGAATALRQCIDFVAAGGRVIMVGISSGPAEIDPTLIVRKEMEIIGSFLYVQEFAKAIELLRSGKVKAESIITHRWPFEKASEAFAMLKQGIPLKAMLLFD